MIFCRPSPLDGLAKGTRLPRNLLITGSFIRLFQKACGNLNTLQATDMTFGTNLAAPIRTGNFDKGFTNRFFLFRIIEQTQGCMEGTAGPAIGLAAAQFTSISNLLAGNILFLSKCFQDALRAIQALVCKGMDCIFYRHVILFSSVST
jgi:hypothetical protein